MHLIADAADVEDDVIRTVAVDDTPKFSDHDAATFSAALVQ
jgi:hypothetical protein